MNGSEMRKLLDQTLAPLNDKVSMSLVAGIRTDIEKMISSLRKEAKAAQEANEALVADNESCRKKNMELTQEVRELKIDLDSCVQKIHGFKANEKKSHEAVKHAAEVIDNLRKTFEPRIDLSKFLPEDVTLARNEFLKVHLDTPPKALIHQVMRSGMADLALNFGSIKMLKWAITLNADDVLDVLFVGFRPGVFLDAVINKTPPDALVKNIDSSSSDFADSGKIPISTRAHRYVGVGCNVDALLLGLLEGVLSVDDNFHITINGEGKNKHWISAVPHASR